MKIIRHNGLAMAGALVLLAALLVPVSTASEAQPEITDVKGDSVSGKDSRDLTSAFFHTETNDTFKISMNLSSLETYTNPNDIPTAPTTEYEVYFTISSSNYAVACRVPVHGPLGMTIQFDIRAVTYGNNTTTENQLSTLSGCTYDAQDHLITWLVQNAAAIVAELVLIARMILGFATGGETGRWAAAQFLGGPYTAVFFSCVVVLGLLVPLVMELVEAKRHLPFATILPVLILTGGLALRWILLTAGQHSAFRFLP